MGFIYKISNNINDKLYIGQTIRNIEERWRQHQTDAKREDKYPNNKFYNAIRKYGSNNFSVSLIEECDNSLLNEREIYWINYYDSQINGYNTDNGGGGGDVGDMVNQYDLCGNYITTFISASEAERYYSNKSDCVSGTIATAARNAHNSHTAYGYQWRYTQDFPIGINIDHIPEKSKCPKPVNQYDLEWNFIASYQTLTEAYKATGIDIISIRRCCGSKPKQYRAGQYRWRFSWDDIL